MCIRDRISALMLDPVPPLVLTSLGKSDAVAPKHNLRLAYLSRQYAAQELGIPNPAVCMLDAFRPKTTPPLSGPFGFMQFSANGAGHYTTLSGCHYEDQSAGEWVAIQTQSEWFRRAPLTIQYRTSPRRSTCSWCQAGYVSYIDGCAVKYGDDQASAGFGGFEEPYQYEPHAAMNGKTHKGWKYLSLIHISEPTRPY
eukprot:TRINITY_DN23475_c0_g1_i1.p1 TRINITY_DN23475_c0_g1~~TRINITY_DN23475_c0_g1_i1.p1  ORF type:complete len:197 (+),score=57.05 TRINITY_DN23475_c0_g1_i1:136-726(+)